MEEGAKEYLHLKGFRDRQLRCWGATNAGTRYYKRVVGDSPELCRGLDSYGFADLRCSIAYHVALSTFYDSNDPRRFRHGTPAEVYSTMKRCWEVEPTSERIVADVLGFTEVLDKLIAAKGCVVPDISLRTGRRATPADGNLKNKPRASQRKSTILRCSRPVHADGLEAHQLACGSGADDAIEALIEDVDSGLEEIAVDEDEADLDEELLGSVSRLEIFEENVEAFVEEEQAPN